ncbi:COG1470 family protein [Kribbella sp. NPDC055071]
MAATMTLSTDSVEVEPGETGGCEVTVTNTGSLVDQFSIDLVGGLREWVTIEPSTLNLMPATSGSVTVTFAPPRSPDLTAGRHAFGVRAESREDPGTSVVEEGAVEVAPYQQIVAELVPAKRRARRHAKFKLAVDNLGNNDAEVGIVLRDPDDELRLETSQASIATKPGTATIVKLRVSPHRRFWRGEPKLLPFEVVASPPVDEPIRSSGVVQQEQLMPKWLLPAMAAAAVLVVAAVAAWFALLKPAVASVATEETQQQVAKAESAASKASGAASQATEAATVAQQAAGIDSSPTPGVSNSTPSPTSAATGTPSVKKPAATPTGPVPLSFRVATDAKVVTDGTFQAFTYQAPPKKKIQIADLVLQNPRGDSGILRISIGKNIQLETGLANFRDLDYHYLEPLFAAEGQPVVVSVNCTAPGAGSDRCTPSVSFSGQLS